MAFSAQTILIAGGGIVGLTLAVALKRELGAAADVVVADPALFATRPESLRGLRVSALAPDCRRLLERTGAWTRVAPEAQPVTAMRLTDSALEDPVRSALFGFDADPAEGEPLAHMVANDDVADALLEQARLAGVILLARRVVRWNADVMASGGAGVARLDGGETMTAHLLVAADGARSSLRAEAGIEWYGWSYGQSGVVATISHSRPHHGVATQHFLPSGAFAILPLTGNRSSIVWSERDENIPAIRALDREDLLAEIRRRFGLERGSLHLDHYPVGVFPLSLGVARRFHAPGMVLAGDAAHQVHPIAGQGLNLGLRDVMALEELVVRAIRLGLPAADGETAREYDRRRRADVMAMALTTDAINRLFSNDVAPLRLLRGVGARLVGRAPGIRRFMARRAAGLASIARG
ncbi:FAD-dependent monooxygenase [Camelimonas abortus]|uniref:FAD-dependent monooxygenase n=1 Tax=Camelimonas abortus TaxID=1017184 RepID=A0ABV7LCT3_9HYPH